MGASVKTDYTNTGYSKTVSRLPFVIPNELYFSIEYDINVKIFSSIRERIMEQTTLVTRNLSQELKNDQ